MKNLPLTGLVLSACLAVASIALAAEPRPTTTVVISSEKALLDNLKGVMADLAASPREFETLRETLQVMLEGIDPAKPISYRSYVVGKELRDVYTLSLTGKLPDFLDSIKSLGYTTRRDAAATRGEELYRFTKLDSGSLRYDPATKTVQIVPLGTTTDKNLHIVSRTLARQVASAPPAQLLAGRDFVFLMENDAATLPDRKAAFGVLKANVNKAVEAKIARESAKAHAFRTALAKQQMAELERYFVESSRLFLGWTTSLKNKTSTFEIELTPLPGTSLAEGVALLEKTPDEFTGVSQQNAIVTANFNYSIDPRRKADLAEAIKLWLPLVQEEIDARKITTPADKQIEKDVAQMASEVVNGVAELGVFNGFLRVYGSGTEYTTVMAARVPDGQKFKAILEKASGHQGAVVKLDADKAGDVAIHSIVLKNASVQFPEFFDGDGIVYYGTSYGTIWSAFGEDGLKALKQAIQEVAAAEAKPGPAVDAKVTVRPLLEAWDRHKGNQGEIGIRKAALEGLKGGKDTLTFKMWKDPQKTDMVRLFLQADEGIIRAVGKIMAKITREKFE